MQYPPLAYLSLLFFMSASLSATGNAGYTLSLTPDTSYAIREELQRRFQGKRIQYNQSFAQSSSGEVLAPTISIPYSLDLTMNAEESKTPSAWKKWINDLLKKEKINVLISDIYHVKKTQKPAPCSADKSLDLLWSIEKYGVSVDLPGFTPKPEQRPTLTNPNKGPNTSYTRYYLGGLCIVALTLTWAAYHFFLVRTRQAKK